MTNGFRFQGGDLLAAAVEDLAGGDGLALGTVRVGDLEELDEVFGDAPRGLGLNRGLPLSRAGSHQADCGQDGSGDQRNEDCCRRRDLEGVAAKELPGSIDGARRPRLYGVVGEVALDIRRECLNRGISPFGRFFERLHDDPIEITPECRRQR